MKHTCIVRPAFALAAALLLWPSEVAAHSPSGTMVGVRAGSYTDTDKPFVGVEFLSYIGNHFYFNPNVEYVFVDEGTFGTLNLDVHVDLPTHGQVYVWVGGGAALLYRNPPGPPGADTSVRGNILGGVGIQAARVIPYFQAKLIAGDNKEVVLAVGLRF